MYFYIVYAFGLTLMFSVSIFALDYTEAFNDNFLPGMGKQTPFLQRE